MHIVYQLDGDPQSPVVATTAPGANLGNAVKVIVGAGQPYYCFNPIPFDFSNGILVNWSGAPLASDDVGENNAQIIVMLETPPLDKIGEVE